MCKTLTQWLRYCPAFSACSVVKIAHKHQPTHPRREILRKDRSSSFPLGLGIATFPGTATATKPADSLPEWCSDKHLFL